jgi:FKBP-type peptidyl-prolyl cis-trans isomerase FkpA
MTALLRPSRLPLLLLLVAVSGCDFGKTSGPTAPDQSNVAYSQTDITLGTGAEATTGSNCTVQYGAWLYSDTAVDHKGTQIDANQFSFVVGTGQVLKGFDQGVLGMKVGGQRRLIVPPSLAYGSNGNAQGGIPPNAALVFDIALTAVTAPQ